MAIYKLKDVVSVKNPKRIFLADYKKSGIPFYRGKEITSKKFDNNLFISHEQYQNIKEKFGVPRKKDILLGAVGTIGMPWFVDSENFYIKDGNVMWINKFAKNINRKYFYLWLSTRGQIKLEKNCIGAVQKALTKTNFLNIEIDIPTIKTQQKIIDIIEPIENSIDKVKNMKSKLLKYISNLETKEEHFFLTECAELVKDSPKGIGQVSASVMNKKNSFIDNLEKKGTYKTNTFFCHKNTLLINTIRTYLEKFSILPIDSDCNGTLAQIHVKEKQTSILHNLMNNNFWEQTQKFSKGTKMPVLNKGDLMNSIKMKEVELEIPNIFELLSTLNNLSIMLVKTKEKIIRILIK